MNILKAAMTSVERTVQMEKAKTKSSVNVLTVKLKLIFVRNVRGRQESLRLARNVGRVTCLTRITRNV